MGATWTLTMPCSTLTSQGGCKGWGSSTLTGKRPRQRVERSRSFPSEPEEPAHEDVVDVVGAVAHVGYAGDGDEGCLHDPHQEGQGRQGASFGAGVRQHEEGRQDEAGQPRLVVTFPFEDPGAEGAAPQGVEARSQEERSATPPPAGLGGSGRRARKRVRRATPTRMTRANAIPRPKVSSSLSQAALKLPAWEVAREVARAKTRRKTSPIPAMARRTWRRINSARVSFMSSGYTKASF